MKAPTMKFNPAFLAESELIAGFVVREHELSRLLEIVAENTRASNQHVLLLGPRGYGKTTLMLRLGAAIRGDPALDSRWYPILFSEEVEVASPGELWAEALFFLGKQTGEARWTDTYNRIRRSLSEEDLRVLALAELREFAEREGKRLLLTVENLQILFSEQISEGDAWTIRHTLQSEPWLMVVTTATARFDAIEDPKQALYELFQMIALEPLSASECARLFSHLGPHEIDPLRGRALQILTGGNPRLIVVLARFTTDTPLDSLVDDLVRLIDDHSDYFKGNIDALPFAERRVFTALAELWAPSTAREVAESARLDVNKTSALLGRLERRGVVTARASSPRRKRYQLSERLYNLYWLMRRHGQASERVRFVVNFIAAYYDSAALPTTCIAFASQALSHPTTTRELHVEAFLQLLTRLAHDERTRVLQAVSEPFLDLLPGPQRERLLIERDQEASPSWTMGELYAGIAVFVAARPLLSELMQSLRAFDRLKAHLQNQSPSVAGNGDALPEALASWWQTSAATLPQILGDAAENPNLSPLEVLVGMALAIGIDSEHLVLAFHQRLTERYPDSPWPHVLHVLILPLSDREAFAKARAICDQAPNHWLIPLAFAAFFAFQDKQEHTRHFLQCIVNPEMARRIAIALLEIRDDLLAEEEGLLFDPRTREFASLLEDSTWEWLLAFLARTTSTYLGDASTAREILRLATEELPRSAKLQLLLALASYTDNKPSRASEAIAHAARLSSNSWEVSLAIGILLAHSGETQRARELILRSWHGFIRTDPPHTSPRELAIAWWMGAAKKIPELPHFDLIATFLRPGVDDPMGVMINMINMITTDRSGRRPDTPFTPQMLVITCEVGIVFSCLGELEAALLNSPLAPRIEPLLLALARFRGDPSPAPTEVEEVASDILARLRLVDDLAKSIRHSLQGPPQPGRDDLGHHEPAGDPADDGGGARV